MSQYPPVGSTAWRTWLTKILHFRANQCWSLEGLIALSYDEGTPGRLELLDDQIASWLDRSLPAWITLRDLMIDRGILRFMARENAVGYYEFAAKFMPCDDLALAPLFSEKQRQLSFDALPDSQLPVEPGAMTDAERQWKRSTAKQFKIRWHHEMTKDATDEWLREIRAWVNAGNKGADFVWKGCRAGDRDGSFVTKKSVTNDSHSVTKNGFSGADRDVTPPVVVASLEKQSDNNTTEQRDNVTSQTVTNPDGGVVTNEMLQVLRQKLAPFHVTFSAVTHRLIPAYGYDVCLSQAEMLPFRDGNELARVYVSSVEEDYAAPKRYLEHLNEAKQKAQLEQERQEKQRRHDEEKQQLLAEKQELLSYLESLSSEEHLQMVEEARCRLAPAIYEKLKGYEARNETPSAMIREAMNGALNRVQQEWLERHRQEVKAVMNAAVASMSGL